MYKKTNELLLNSIEKAFNTDLNSETKKDLHSAFQKNIADFSYAKTLTQFNYFKDFVFDSKNNIRSFEALKKQVADAGELFNNTYLKVELDYVRNSSIMALKWQNLDAEYLEFSTAGDSRVRPEHKLFDKFTAQKSDPIWKRLFTPLDWGCRCTIIPGKKNNVSDVYNSKWANTVVDPLVKDTIFDNNAGITKEIFNKNHPYFKSKK